LAELDQIRSIMQTHKTSLMSRENVVGVGLGEKESHGHKTGELSVVVLVRQKKPLVGLGPNAIVPKQVDDVKTDVVEVGDIRAQQARTDRWRPAPGGVSLGHYKITAGTFGVVVRDRASGERLLLSNNHVLANCNVAQPGDAILQPGTADGGKEPEAVLARLERFERIRFEGEGRLSANLVDAAVARPVEEQLGTGETPHARE